MNNPRWAALAAWAAPLLVLGVAHLKLWQGTRLLTGTRFPRDAATGASIGLAFLLAETALLVAARPRWRLWIAAGANGLWACLIGIDLAHARFYGDVVSLGEAFNLGQLRRVASSLGHSWSFSDAWLLADLVIVALLAASRGLPGFAPAAGRARLSVAMALLVAAGTLAGPSVSTVRSDAEQIFGYVTQRREVVGRLGLSGYHAHDAWVFARDSILARFGVSAAARRAARGEVRARRRADLGRSPLFGSARGASVILVLVESLMDWTIGLRIGAQPITPHLTALANESLHFRRFFDQTHTSTTADAELLTLQSLLPLSAGAVQTRVTGLHPEALPALLQRQGYATHSFSGADGDFWNMRSFHARLGFEASHFVDDLPGERFGLGLLDRDFFDSVGARLLRQRAPFLAYLITLTGHYDYALPPGEPRLDVGPHQGSVLGNYLQAVHYVDAALGAFVAGLRESGLLDRSLLVVVGDHKAFLGPAKPVSELLGFSADAPAQEWLAAHRLPLLIRLPGAAYAGERLEAGGHLDVAPTLVSLLGLPPEALPVALGADLLRERERFVVFRDGAMVADDWLYLPGPGTPHSLSAIPRPPAQGRAALARRRDALFQASDAIVFGDLAPSLARAEVGFRAAREGGAPSTGPPLVIGHRGDPAHYPENTLASIVGGFAAGADLVEIDLLATRDGEAVAIHDPDLAATTDGRGPLVEQDLRAVLQLDAGFWKAPRFAGLRLPTLRQALEVASGRPLFLDPQAAGLGAAIARVARELELSPKQLLVNAWDAETLQDLVRHLPGGRFVWGGPLPREPDATWLDSLLAQGVIAIEVDHREGLRRDWAQATHERGLGYWTYTIDEERQFREAVTCEVDAIETNDPAWMVELRGSKGAEAPP